MNEYYSVYSDYSVEEQALLRRSLQAAAVAVSAASPGRQEETASEGFAAARFILEGRAAYVGNSLISSLIMALDARIESEQAFPDYLEAAAASDAFEAALATLRAVAALLDAKATPDDAAGYKGWLARIAGIVAEAGTEDQGFLGMGGVQVNEAERRALDEIDAALGLPPA